MCRQKLYLFYLDVWHVVTAVVGVDRGGESVGACDVERAAPCAGAGLNLDIPRNGDCHREVGDAVLVAVVLTRYGSEGISVAARGAGEDAFDQAKTSALQLNVGVNL